MRSRCCCTRCVGARGATCLSSTTVCGGLTFSICGAASGPCSMKCRVTSGCLSRTLVCYLRKGVTRTRGYLTAKRGLVGPGLLSSSTQVLFVSKAVSFCLGSCPGTRGGLLTKLRGLRALDRRGGVGCSRSVDSSCRVLTRVCRRRGLCSGTLTTRHGSVSCTAHLGSGGGQGRVGALHIGCGLSRTRHDMGRLSILGRREGHIGLLTVKVVVLTLVAVVLLIVHRHSHRGLGTRLLRVTRLGRRRTSLVVRLRGSGLRRGRGRFRAVLGRSGRHRMRSCLRNLRTRQRQLTARLRSSMYGGLVTLRVRVQTRCGRRRSMTPAVMRALARVHGQIHAISRRLVPPAFRCTALSRVLRSFVARLGLPRGAGTRCQSAPNAS